MLTLENDCYIAIEHILHKHFPTYMKASCDYHAVMAACEKAILEYAIKRSKGSLSAAGRMIGVGRNKMRVQCIRRNVKYNSKTETPRER